MTNTLMLSEYSIERLEAEIARRKEKELPLTLEHVDFSYLRNKVIHYVERTVRDTWPQDDSKTDIFEAAVESVYGKDIWRILNG